MNNNQRDDLLWQLAKRRAAFKWSFAAYFFTNCFLIAIWFFTGGIHAYFWPIWSILGWGLGIAFQYISAYQSHKFFTAEEEYERLKNQYQ
jgi:hypothetical protein